MSENAARALQILLDRKSGYSILRISAGAQPEDLKAISPLLEDFRKSSGHLVVISDINYDSMPGTVRSLVQLQNQLKTEDRHIRLVRVSADDIKMLKSSGLDTILRVCPTVSRAMTEFGISQATLLDVTFINPFLEATMKMMGTQASTNVTKTAILRKKSTDPLDGDISGVIHLNTEMLMGLVIISFPMETFLKLMSRMLGEDIQVFSKDVEDGAAEFMNIIYGDAKVNLNGKGYNLQKALPKVLLGTQIETLYIGDGHRVAVWFESDIGKFVVEIYIAS